MSILITGGAGFIGSHLAERLLKQDGRVIILDDFNDYYSPALKRDNVSSIIHHPCCTIVSEDIRNRERVSEIFETYDVQRVVHLAARAGVRPSLENPFLYEDVNVQGTMNILEACRTKGVSNLLVASSSSVYGNSPRVPFREDDPANMPISPYAATKRSVELICHTFHHLYQIPITCLRFFTVYGPRQRPDMSFHIFARQILSGESIRMFGDGSTRRDYTFIRDIVDGLVAALERPNGYEIVNLGNSRTVRLQTVLEIFQETLQCKAKIERHPEQPGDVRLTSADISKAQKLYGYHPKVNVKEGISEFVEWYIAAQKKGIV